MGDSIMVSTDQKICLRNTGPSLKGSHPCGDVCSVYAGCEKRTEVSYVRYQK